MHIPEAAQKLDKAKEELPDFGELYKKKAKYAQEIEVHANEGVFPEELFRKRSPYQTQDEFDYVRNNYQAVSVSVMEEFFGVTNRIFNDSNYSIKYQEEGQRFKKQPLSDYIEKEYPIYDSLIGHFKGVLKRAALIDPNGAIAVNLHNPPFREVERDGEIILELDDSQMLDPIVRFYSSKDIISHDEFQLTALSKERSWVEKGNNEVKEGYVFDYYDQNVVGKYVQFGQKSEYQFRFVQIYEHGLEELPARSVGENPTFTEEGAFYQSPIHPAVEPLNIVALDNSRLNIVKEKAAFPIKWAMEDPCDYEGEHGVCEGGYVWNGGEKTECPKCHGSGFKSDTPLTVYRMRTPGDGAMESDKSAPTPPVGFVSPDTTTMEFLRKEINENIELAKSELRINVSNEHVRGSDTALGKQIDREEMFSFLKGISDHMFSLFRWSIDMIGGIRYQDGYTPPVISEPDEFAIRSSQDITEEIAQAKERDLPNIFQHKLLEEQLEKRFNNDDESREVFRTYIAVDRLANLNNEEIKTVMAQRRAALWEVILHDSFFSLLEEAKSNDPEFMQQEMQVRKQVLTQAAQTKATEINPQTLPEEQPGL